MQHLFGVNATLHVVLALLDRYFKPEWALVWSQFERVFPFVEYASAPQVNP